MIDEAIHVANQGMESIESEKEQSTDEDKEIIQTKKSVKHDCVCGGKYTDDHKSEVSAGPM